MRRLRHFATPWWLAGIILAAVGVLLARFAAPGLGERARALTALAGELLALGGLVVIAIGVSRRVHRDTAP